MRKRENVYVKVLNWMNSKEKHNEEVKTFIFVCIVFSLFLVALFQHIKLSQYGF